MNGIGRRGFLQALGIAPAAARVMAEEAKLQMLGGGVGGVGLANRPQAVPPSAMPERLTTFADYIGRAERGLREQAREIRGFDPDIVEMRLPLTTKVRMQRERNYRRIVESQKGWFARQVERLGFVQWWPE